MLAVDKFVLPAGSAHTCPLCVAGHATFLELPACWWLEQPATSIQGTLRGEKPMHVACACCGDNCSMGAPARLVNQLDVVGSGGINPCFLLGYAKLSMGQRSLQQ
jgi:hypothetical protein